MATARATSRAMGCDVSIVVRAHDRRTATALARAGAVRIQELERRWTRFSADSELMQLNRAGGAPVRVSAPTLTLVQALVRAWRTTDGAFDPTLLSPLVGLGYAASRDDARRCTAVPVDIAPRGDVAAIDIDHDRSTVRLPRGTALDAGGLGKGVAADLVTAELMTAGARAALAEIGGDLAARGEPATGTWPIRIADPFAGDPVPTPSRSAPDSVVELGAGGVATSSVRRRTWTTDGEHRHHVLDPATGRPTTGDVVAATVVAGSATWAEAFATYAMVTGIDAALLRCDALGLAARVTTADGRHHRSTRWADHERLLPTGVAS